MLLTYVILLTTFVGLNMADFPTVDEFINRIDPP